MPPTTDARSTKPFEPLADFRFLNFSELVRRPVCAGKIGDRIGRLDDIVFALAEPYPEVVGLYMEYGWNKPTQFVPWNRVIRIDDDAIFVKPNEGDAPYPPFVDQPGWVMVEKHLVGRTILDIDGRQVEAVNDVQMVESRGRMVLVHVDVSLNGFLRRWGLGGLRLFKERLIGWKYDQPLNVDDAVQTDTVSLSVTRRQLADLPGEDLADALEELSGPEQEALFSALDSEKAAETLLEAEPRAQRQIIAGMRSERARNVLSEMSVAQLADLFSVLPHDHVEELLELLPGPTAERLRDIRSEREATADALVSPEFVTATRERTAGDMLRELRTSGRDPHVISYVYVIEGEDDTLTGVVDLRDLVLAGDDTTLGDLMASPVISAQDDDLRDDLQEIFAKYHFRMLPVVNRSDHLLGVVRYTDIMKGVVARARS